MQESEENLAIKRGSCSIRGSTFALIYTEEIVRCFPCVTDLKIASYLLVSRALK